MKNVFANSISEKDTPARNASGIAWFSQAKLGLFIHWGLYSLLGKGEWALQKERLDIREYNRLAERLNPQGFSPEAWADLAVQMGARYMVFTTRHHDGFCLFESRETNYNSTCTGAKRDYVAEYVKACRSRGLKVGLYYSIMNWQFPAVNRGPFVDPDGWEAMVSQTHRVLAELMTNYGKIDLLWYDGACVPSVADPARIASAWRSAELNQMVRRLQPDILINDRSGLPEDFDTPEQEIVPSSAQRMWESCITLNHSWGYRPNDLAYKTPAEIAAILVRCAQSGGNLLLNISPKGDGTLAPEAMSCLNRFSGWVKMNQDSIFGTQRSAFSETQHAAGPATSRSNRVYFHFFGKVPTRFRVAGLGAYALSARRLSDGAPCQIHGTGEGNADIEIPIMVPAETLPPVIEIALRSPIPKVRPIPVLRVPGRQFSATDAPILAVQSGRCEPDEASPVEGRDIHFSPQPSHLITWKAGKNLCPGWDGQVAVTSNGELNFEIEVPHAGQFELELGLLAEQRGNIKVAVDQEELGCFPLSAAGYPVKLSLPNLSSHQEWKKIKLQLDREGTFGLYAYRLQPIWRPIPANCWLTSGPFLTAFCPPNGRAEEVRKALATVYPPERSITPQDVDQEIWSWDPQNMGQYSNIGVNFPYRCGAERSGVCYALTFIDSPIDQVCKILIGSDWWANASLNGTPLVGCRSREAVAADGAEFNQWKPSPADLPLKAGRNTLLIKSHPGQSAHWFTCRISDPGNLNITATTVLTEGKKPGNNKNFAIDERVSLSDY
ncbi:MAG: alpha-L-fucosidase [Chthoniobacteraceae bacterium]